MINRKPIPRIPNLTHLSPVDIQNAVTAYEVELGVWLTEKGIQTDLPLPSCKRGHRMTKRNTYRRQVKRQHGVIWERYCAVCHRDDARDTMRRKRRIAKNLLEEQAIKAANPEFGKLLF